MLIKREADVDKIDVNESRESTGWAMLGGNRGTCDVEKIDGLNWRRGPGEGRRIET